jgi:hypothetical protein
MGLVRVSMFGPVASDFKQWSVSIVECVHMDFKWNCGGVISTHVCGFVTGNIEDGGVAVQVEEVFVGTADCPYVKVTKGFSGQHDDDDSRIGGEVDSARM